MKFVIVREVKDLSHNPTKITISENSLLKT